MNPEYRNAPSPSVPSSAAEISASTADPAMVSSPSPSDPLLPPNVEGTLGPTVMPPLTPAQIPLPPSVDISIGSAAALSERTGLSARALMRQQGRDYLVHLFSIASLANSPLLTKVVAVRLSMITRLRTSMRADLEALLLPDRSTPLPDDINNLISIARYTDRYIVAHGDHITETMW